MIKKIISFFFEKIRSKENYLSEVLEEKSEISTKATPYSNKDKNNRESKKNYEQLKMESSADNSRLLYETKWNENYTKLKKYVKKNNKFPSQSDGKIGIWVGSQKRSFNNNTLSIKRIDLLLKISPDFFEMKKLESWESRYEELKIYFLEHKKLPAKREIGLGRWVGVQKAHFNNNTLSKEKMNLLLDITIEFLESKSFVWNENYKNLQRYFLEHKKLPAKREIGLGIWVGSQKRSFNNNTLSKERIDLLLKISPDFFEVKSQQVNWTVKYEELKTYFLEHKELPHYKNESLGLWVTNQKWHFNKNTLSNDKIKLLLDICPDLFEVKKQQVNWTVKYEELKTYFLEHKELPVSRNESLGLWFTTQKRSFNNNTLSKERIDLLLKISPDLFEKKFESWESRYEEFKAYFLEHKELPDFKNESLGIWIGNQKWSFNKNTLSNDKIKLLLGICPDLFEVKKQQVNWMVKYEELKKYLLEHKELPHYKDENLGIWIGNQRKNFNKNILSKERIDLLLKISPDFFEKKYNL